MTRQETPLRPTTADQARCGRSRFVPLGPCTTIHVRVIGEASERPPLVALHGNRDNHTHFEPVVAHVQDRQIVLVDLRGHGLSSPLCTPASPDLFAADIDAVLEALELRRIVLMGHSLGSVISMTYAGMRPHAVSGLVLLGTAAVFELGFRRPDVAPTEETWPIYVAEANQRAAPLFFTDGHPEVAEHVLSSWATMALETHRNLVRMRHPDLRSLVPTLPGPILVMTGSEDRCTTPEAARWIADNHTDAGFHAIEGCGHFAHIERPDVVGAHLAEFLGKLDDGLVRT